MNATRKMNNESIAPVLIPVKVRKTGEQVMVDDLPSRLGLLVTYNPWHYYQEHDVWYHDDELEFLGQRNQ